MTVRLEILRLGKSSRARRIDTLTDQVKDLVVAAWHTPQALAVARNNRRVRTRIELAMNPGLLKHLQAEEANRCIGNLCAWLQGFGVEYAVGYAPNPVAQGGAFVDEHTIAVALFNPTP